ncbi:uncharacterized protein FMAN_11645 [Fusarium mangiferae]|uniref:2EXR domain-containing protein n=1 Tax=Fusarium mangiferae TaxID=192010 RepID=A0A1L7TG27_FUSMA|nr:uncharacterized protein FMAN_11645 [Fusarium mangiferae]CVK97650.1 uncharacterized protein FMAN_11645 [Fusarium mangiferae]
MESSKPPSGESSVQHPSILNPVMTKSNLSFHLFPQLPKEIREMVWTQSLTCERYIAVELWSRSVRGGGFYLQKSLSRGPPVDEQYRLVLVNPPRPSAIFGTSTESRASACRFYRVHLPCFLLRRSQSAAPGTFWFNPELDTLEIRGLESFTNFAHDFWRHDCQKAGLRNVCFDARTRLSFDDFYQLAASPDQLRQVVSRLEHVTFIYYTEDDRVDMAFRRYSNWAPSYPRTLHHLRSLPIAGATGSFSRQRDLRPMEDGILNCAFISAFFDVGRIVRSWQSGFRRLRATKPCDFRLAYATGAFQIPFIADRADAMEYLMDEEEKWQECFDNASASPPRGPWLFLNGVPEQLDSQLQTAFGFWTVSLEPQDQVASDYPHQPELCLFHL